MYMYSPRSSTHLDSSVPCPLRGAVASAVCPFSSADAPRADTTENPRDHF